MTAGRLPFGAAPQHYANGGGLRSDRDLPRAAGVSYSMRIAFLIGLVMVTAACEGYQFPGPEGGTGTVHGQVTGFACGGWPVQATHPCPACPPSVNPGVPTCSGEQTLSGFELSFTNGGTNRIAKTDASGGYSIDLPAGTWKVSAASFGRITDGPQTVDVSLGASIQADYVVDTGIRAAA